MKRLIFFGLTGLVLLGLFVQFDLGAYFAPEMIRATLDSYGIWAPIIFVAAYVAVTILFLPATPLTLLGGAFFGLWWGSALVIIGATLGAVCAFLLSRFVGGNYIRSLSGTYVERLREYETRLVANGFVTVLLLRLLPLVPFNGLNFALGLTRVRFSDYTWATLLGIIPGTVAYVYFGSAVAELSLRDVLLAAFLIAGLILSGVYLGRSHKSKI